MEPSSQPRTAGDIPEEISPSAHALGVPRVEVSVTNDPVRQPAAWPATLATILVIIATSLYLLVQLQLVLRPLLIAILLCYLIVPAYARLRKRMRPIFSFLLIILVLVVGFQVISGMIFNDMKKINNNLPRYQHRAEELSDRARDLFEPFLPPSLMPDRIHQSESVAGTEGRKKTQTKKSLKVATSGTNSGRSESRDAEKDSSDSSVSPVDSKSGLKEGSSHQEAKQPPGNDLKTTAAGKTTSEKIDSEIMLEGSDDGAREAKYELPTTMVPPSKPIPTESPTWEITRRLISQVLNAVAGFVVESLVVAFYMIFLLQEVGKFSDRIRTSFSREHAGQIESVVASINRGITDYLSVKVKSSLLVAIPTALAVYAFGVTGAASWGVLAFFGNFLPYVGGLVATLLPITLAYLEFDSLLYPTLFAAVLIGISGITSNLIEPAMTGKALDLSPLVVMISLAFWSLLWGFVGMCLAVPLTVALKIILEHTPATRPIARMLGESQRPV